MLSLIIVAAGIASLTWCVCELLAVRYEIRVLGRPTRR